MGAWGYGWTQNDDAYDLFGEVAAPMRKAWDRVLSRSPRTRWRWYGQARAAAGLAIQWSDMLTEGDMEDAAKALRVILSDEEHVQTWASPCDFRKSVRSDLRKLERRIKASRESRVRGKKKR